MTKDDFHRIMNKETKLTDDEKRERMDFFKLGFKEGVAHGEKKANEEAFEVMKVITGMKK